MSDPAVNRARTEGAAVVRDPDFYLESLIFKAGCTVFKVPLYVLPKEEGIFSAMFDLPNGNGEGLNEDNPVCLPAEVTAEDFRCFLKARVIMPDITRPTKLTITEWMSVIKLANMWCLEEPRAQAIAAADKLLSAYPTHTRAVCYISFGKKYHVSRWLLKGYEALGTRDTYLSSHERQTLGAETSLRISELREMSWAWARKQRPPSMIMVRPYQPLSPARRPIEVGIEDCACNSRAKFDFKSSIHTLFADELRLDSSYAAPAVASPQRPT
ncbi:unnamed protein product [Peniophora sp. CBMAI 1063]|nr:unnamed protein product [Peniophora sp. CBMAI 1063]